jgi:membrane protein
VLTLLFSMLFKWCPDREMAWRDIWPGGAITALLFNIGKVTISWDIGTQGLESTYGAAAAIVVLLIWICYSAQIVLIGAEVTHVYAARRHERRPNPRKPSPVVPIVWRLGCSSAIRGARRLPRRS